MRCRRHRHCCATVPDTSASWFKGVDELLEAHDAGSVAEIRGRMRADQLGEPEALFRTNYRRTLLCGYPSFDIEPRLVRKA